jgi:hypothetical protein
MTSTKERVKKWRDSQRKSGKRPFTIWCTEDELYYLRRVLYQMRATNSVPCTMRNSKGKFEHLDT